MPEMELDEKALAVRLANQILDRPGGDPDDDLAILSRQFLRAIESDGKAQSERLQMLWGVVHRIANYESPERLHKIAEREYGCSGPEAIEMAYGNVLQEAMVAVKQMRTKKRAAGLVSVPVIGKGE
jgi:hypothetical protein